MTDAASADSDAAADPLSRIDFARGDGLVVTIAQECTTREILMVAFANRAAVESTLQTGFAHFFSRSRNAQWKKGETSGNLMPVRTVSIDCDGDALIYQVDFPEGVACHTGARTCFFDHHAVEPRASNQPREPLLATVQALLHAYAYLRDTELESESGTSRLLRGGDDAKLASRLRDELDEMLGVLDGSHTHEGQTQSETLELECSQVWYWAVVGAVAARADVSADECVDVLLSPAASPTDTTALGAACDALPTLSPRERALGACAIIAAACAQLGVAVAAPLEHDLRQMRSKPYLQAVLGV